MLEYPNIIIGRILKIKNIRGIAAAALVAFAAMLVSPVAANAATTTYNLDCDAANSGNNIWYAQTGDTVTLNLTNCTAFVTDPFGPSPVATPVTGSWVGNPGDQGLMQGTNTQGVFIGIGEIKAQHTPAGTLLASKDITIGANPKELVVGPSSDPNDPEEDHFLAGKEECGVAIGDSKKHVYATLPIKITKAGTYTFRGTGSTPQGSYYSGGAYHPLEDSFLAVYKDFDPKKSDANVVGCNDDLNDQFDYDNDVFMEDLGNGVTMEGHQPYFTANMKPGYYTLVLMTWESISAAHWKAGVNGGNTSFAAGPASTHFELWGPTGGLTTNFVRPALAETGSMQNAMPLVFAAMLSFIASVVLIRSPKRRK
jgi:hypothetical protein